MIEQLPPFVNGNMGLEIRAFWCLCESVLWRGNPGFSTINSGLPRCARNDDAVKWWLDIPRFRWHIAGAEDFLVVFDALFAGDVPVDLLEFFPAVAPECILE